MPMLLLAWHGSIRDAPIPDTYRCHHDLETGSCIDFFLRFETMELFSTAWWSALMAIILIDLVLAGDNAIVIALAARKLPPEWPQETYQHSCKRKRLCGAQSAPLLFGQP